MTREQILQISNRIKKLRHQKQMSQSDLAQAISAKTTSVVSAWEQCVRPPENRNLVQLALLADPPLCWEFLEAAGIRLDEIMEKIQNCRFGLYEKREPPKEKRRPLQTDRLVVQD